MNASLKLVVVLELFGQAKNDECISETRRLRFLEIYGQSLMNSIYDTHR